MKMQLEGEERKMKDMMNAMQQQALLEKTEAERIAGIQNTDTKQPMQEPEKSAHAEVR